MIVRREKKLKCEKRHLRIIIRCIFPECLGKRVVIDLELGDLVVLVRRHTDESALDQIMDKNRLLILLGYEPGNDHSRLVLVH